MSPAIVCVAAGVVVGPLGFRLIDPALREHGRLIESACEILLLVLLFCVGLRTRARLEWSVWRTPLQLATVTTLATMLLIAGCAHVLFDLGFPAALLVGAILAPTDPVLASNAPLPPGPDADGARTTLALEGALNNGLAFPGVLLALGLMGLHDLGPAALRWLVADVAWAAACGLAAGWLLGWAAARALARLETDRQGDFVEALLVIGAVAIAYGGAQLLGGYGLLAAFTAGVALCNGGRLRRAAPPRRLSARFSAVALRLERVAESAALLLLGAMLAVTDIRPAMFVFALLVLLAVRPLAVHLGLGHQPLDEGQRRLLAWFGMRGVASIFYLMFALNSGLGAPLAREVAALTLVVLVTSVVLHGLSTMPLTTRHLDQEG